MYYKILASFFFALAYFECSAQTIVKFDDPHIRYSGRIAMQDSAAVLSWSGTSVDINFEGTGIKYSMRDEGGDNYYNVILDGKISNVEHEPANKTTEYTISGLALGTHHLELFKRTEWAMGKTWFYGFKIDGKVLPPPPEKKRKIEIFGNSISCGYAVLDTE